MREYFITARSRTGRRSYDTSERYVEADSADKALRKFAREYSHPMGLYAAECWNGADDYHKRKTPLARWESNHLQALNRGTEDKSSYGYLGKGPGRQAGSVV